MLARRLSRIAGQQVASSVVHRPSFGRGWTFRSYPNDVSPNRRTLRIAERAKAEEALRQAQKMEAVGQLTGGVAHDFNNLLTIIKSSTELLRRRDLAEDRRRRYVNAISDTVDRASKLTGQLLSFARRQALKPEVFDVAERLRGVADMLRTIVGSRIRIVTEIACDSCYVEADVSQFETALVNIAVIVALYLLSAAFLIPALGQGLLISAATRNQFLASQLSLITGFLPSFLLSRFLFEIKSMPPAIQLLTAVLPARYFVPSLLTVFLAGDIWPMFLHSIAFMLLIGFVLFLVAARSIRKRIG